MANDVALSETRPWGSWHVLEEGAGFKVKRIVVDPRSRLSYQYHHHRAEHWFVVTGEATCVVDGTTTVLAAGQSIDIAVGLVADPVGLADETLVIIEVQRGDYTGEDDIVRLEDDYGRSDG